MLSSASMRRSGWNGFATKLVRRSSHAASAAAGGGVCRAEDHTDIGEGVGGTDVREDREAVDSGQTNVEHHRVGPEIVQPRQSVLAVSDFADVVAREPQGHPGQGSVVGFVFDDQDRVPHDDVGSRTTKRAPLHRAVRR